MLRSALSKDEARGVAFPEFRPQCQKCRLERLCAVCLKRQFSKSLESAYSGLLGYLGLAFCIGHEYDLAYGRIWDYSMGHKPGEAAMYTASALIDGLPYQAFDAKDATIQAAYFGETFMIWRIDEATGNWTLQLDPGKS
jgi:hypothetical protein